MRIVFVLRTIQGGAPAFLLATLVRPLHGVTAMTDTVFRRRRCRRLTRPALLHKSEVDDLAHLAILRPGTPNRNTGGYHG
jgi:hypothetical protein